jgi:hypothetical protein
MSNDTTLALLDNFRARVPGATDEIIKLEFYNTVDELAREALRVAAPVDVDADPADWLDSAQWVPNYQAILHGTLYRLYAHIGKPWSNPDLANQHFGLYTTYLDLARTEAADGPVTALTRLMSAVRVLVPFARDAGIEFELFGVVNQVRMDALALDELDGTDPDTTTWLTAAQYADAYQALYHGLLGRMYSQGGKPWADPDLAQLHTQKFLIELNQLRSNSHDEQDTALERLMNDLRVKLPSARDDVIKQEIYSAADEFFKTSGVWREEITFPVTTTSLIYDIESEETYAKIHRLVRVTTDDDTPLPINAIMKVPHEVTLRYYPAVADTYIATVQLTIGEPVDSEGFPHIPTWAYDQYRESLLDGTLGRMMSQLSKPWSNDRMSTYHLRRFRNAMAQARVDGQRTFLQGAQAWSFPRGWR